MNPDRYLEAIEDLATRVESLKPDSRITSLDLWLDVKNELRELKMIHAGEAVV